MKTVVCGLAVVGVIVWASEAARAQGVPRHERITVTPMKQGGEVVGMRIKATLRTEHSNLTSVRLGLAPKGGFQGGDSNAFRSKAGNASEGFLLHQWPEMKVELNKPKEITLEVKFADAGKLKPGQEIEIVSAWPSGNTFHVYGMSSSISGPVPSYKVLGSEKPVKPTAASRTTSPKPRAKAPRQSSAQNHAASRKARATVISSSSKSAAQATRGLSSPAARAKVKASAGAGKTRPSAVRKGQARKVRARTR